MKKSQWLLHANIPMNNCTLHIHLIHNLTLNYNNSKYHENGVHFGNLGKGLSVVNTMNLRKTFSHKSGFELVH
jgi:hypothetical protein